MKRLFLLTFTLFSFLVSAQTFEARYSMTITYDFSKVNHVSVTGNVPSNFKAESFDLHYDGYLYRSGDSTISFLRPLYLKDFPDGNVKYKVTGVDYAVFTASTDTLQNVKLIVCGDSVCTIRNWLNLGITGAIPGNQGKGSIYTYSDRTVIWKSTNENKEINGLKCEKMLGFYNLDKAPKFECWIYKGLISTIGINGEVNVPGLILEGSESDGPITVRYKLDYLKVSQPLPKGIFWPEAFNKLEFIDYRDPANRKKAADEIKEALKNVDIMAQ